MKFTQIALLFALLISLVYGGCVTFYEHHDKRGRKLVRCSGRGNFHGFWNDRISAVCTSSDTKVYIYAHSNYRGKRLYVGPGRCITRFKNVGYNDVASSYIIVKKTCRSRNHCRNVRRRRCVRKPYRVAVKRRVRTFRYYTAYKYVNVRHRRKVCYMKRVNQRYAYLQYYRARQRYRASYLRRVSYRAWQNYKVRVRKYRSVKYKHYYYVWRTFKRVVRRRKRVRYSRLVVVPKRCKRAYWHYYWTNVRRTYNSYCTRRQAYIKTIRYRGTCSRRKRVSYLSNQMYFAGGCWKKKTKYRYIKVYYKCWRYRKVRAHRNVRYKCKKWKLVRVRRRTLRYRWGNYCRQKVKRYFWKWVGYNAVVTYRKKVRIFTWRTRRVPYYVTSVRRRLVTRYRLVVSYRWAYRFVQAVRRVYGRRWTTVPAYRWGYFTTRRLKSYRARRYYYKYVTSSVTRYRNVCFNYNARSCRRVNHCYWR